MEPTEEAEATNQNAYEIVMEHRLSKPPEEEVHLKGHGIEYKSGSESDDDDNESDNVYSEIGPKKTSTLTNVLSAMKRKPVRRQYSDPLKSRPPPILHKRPPLLPPATNRPVGIAELDTSYTYQPQTLSLFDLVKKHSSRFPLRITVQQGFCSNVEEGSIGTSETYDIHFLKYTKVVYMSLRDVPSQMYAVPLSSAVQFRLLYDPDNNLNNALKGFTFKSVAEILALKPPLPNVIKATKSYKGSNPSTSVQEGEVLVVTGIRKPRVVGTHLLKVYSLTGNEEKSLQPQCEGHFTTSPQSLLLPDILDHVPNPIPSNAVVHIDRARCNYEFVPESLIGEVVSLTHSSIETSLIATLYSSDDSEISKIPSNKSSIFDIPINLDIEVSLVPLMPLEMEKLCMETTCLYESFDPERLSICKPFSSSESYAIQTQLYRVVHESHRMEGIQIQRPVLAFAVQTMPTQHDMPSRSKSLSTVGRSTPPLPPRGEEPSSSNLAADPTKTPELPPKPARDASKRLSAPVTGNDFMEAGQKGTLFKASSLPLDDEIGFQPSLPPRRQIPIPYEVPERIMPHYEPLNPRTMMPRPEEYTTVVVESSGVSGNDLVYSATTAEVHERQESDERRPELPPRSPVSQTSTLARIAEAPTDVLDDDDSKPLVVGHRDTDTSRENAATTSNVPAKSTALPPATTKSTALSPATAKSTALPPATTKSTALPPSTTKSTALPPATTKSTALPPATTKSTALPPATTKSTALPPATTKSTALPPATTKSTALPPATTKSTALPPATAKLTALPTATAKSTALPPATTKSTALPTATTKSTALPPATTKSTALPPATTKSTALPPATTKLTALPPATTKSTVLPQRPTIPPKPSALARIVSPKAQETTPPTTTNIPSTLPDHPRETGDSKDVSLPTFEELQSQIDSLENSNKNTTSQIAGLESQIARVMPIVDRIVQQQQSLRDEVQELRKQLSMIVPKPSVSVYTEEEERNRKYLKSLDCEKTLALLDLMDLQQYKGMFMQECISGEVLVECDSTVLDTELGVTSSLHRAKIMQLVTGKLSARKILEGRTQP